MGIKILRLLVKFFALSLGLSFVSTPVLAGYIFSPSFTHLSRTLNNEGTTGKVKFTILDIRVGYQFDMGLYVGGAYSLGSESANYAGGPAASDFFVGPSLGFKKWNAYLIGTYYIVGERDLDAGGVKYANGKGYQVDLGYMVPITAVFRLGPQLTYRDIEFGDLQTNGLGGNANYDTKGVTPYIVMWWQF